MPVMMVIELPGMGQPQYDAVMQALGLSKASAWPKGILSHAAGPSPTGWTVVDLWESEADFVAFQQSRLGPAFQKVGGLPEPKVMSIPVHFSHAVSASAKAKAPAAKKPAAKKKKKK
jgi:hypothetical protein